MLFCCWPKRYMSGTISVHDLAEVQVYTSYVVSSQSLTRHHTILWLKCIMPRIWRILKVWELAYINSSPCEDATQQCHLVRITEVWSVILLYQSPGCHIWRCRPCKHEPLTHSWFNLRRTSQTVVQRSISTSVCPVVHILVLEAYFWIPFGVFFHIVNTSP